MKICPECGAELDDKCKFCFECGAKLNVKCPNCGEELEANCKFCFNCGTPVGAAQPKTATSSTQPVTAQNDNLFDFSGMEAGFDSQLEKQAAYEKKLAIARSYAIRKMFDEARAVYNGLIEEDPSDVNGYIGLIRIATKNYTEYESAEIDEAISVAKQIADTEDLGQFDKNYAEYEQKRKAYFAEKEATRIAEEKRKAEESRKAAEAARIAEEKRKAEEARKAAEAARIAEEKRKAEAENKRKQEEARLAEERRKAEDRRKFLADFEIEGTKLKKYNGNAAQVIIPDGITEIGVKAFCENRILKSVTIPNGVCRIDNGAFMYCMNLESVNIPNGVTYIGDYAFFHCALKDITIPRSVQFIGSSAFLFMRVTVRVPAGSTYVGLHESMFGGKIIEY